MVIIPLFRGVRESGAGPPYLVQPVEEAYDSGERPVNVDKSNVVWVDFPDAELSAEGLQIAYLWGAPKEGGLNGTLVKFPSKFIGEIQSNDSDFHAVVIQGQLQYQLSGKAKALKAGSYFSSKEKAAHQILIDSDEIGIVYVRTKGRFGVIAN